MKTSSAKAKGRRLQQYVAEYVRNVFGLAESDVASTGMGQSGMDVQLSAAARDHFPYATECKNTEKLAVWQAIKQAESNKEEGLQPLVVFTRNRSDTYVIVEFGYFMNLHVIISMLSRSTDHYRSLLGIHEA